MAQAEPADWRSAAGTSNLKIQGDTRDAPDPNYFRDGSPKRRKGIALGKSLPIAVHTGKYDGPKVE